MLVVEDVVTTGGSTRETIAVAEAAGATVVGAAAIIDRGGGRRASTCRFTALVDVSLPDLAAPTQCPICAAGVPGRRSRARGPWPK